MIRINNLTTKIYQQWMKIKMAVIMMPVTIIIKKVTRPRNYWLEVDEENNGRWNSQID